MISDFLLEQIASDSSFYIRFVEEEIKEPVSIFELRGAKYGEE